MKRFYIAYGSNLNKAHMKLRCPDAVAVGTQCLSNYGLTFKGSDGAAYLTIEDKYLSWVPVAVWEVSKQDELNLDIYEGYPNLYKKVEMPLTFNDINTGCERTENCFIYIMEDGYSRAMPSDRYLESCRKGYEDFGFDQKYLYSGISNVRLWKTFAEYMNMDKMNSIQNVYSLLGIYTDTKYETCLLTLFHDGSMDITYDRYIETSLVKPYEDGGSETLRTDAENTRKFLLFFNHEGNFISEIGMKFGDWDCLSNIKEFYDEHGIEYTYKKT